MTNLVPRDGLRGPRRLTADVGLGAVPDSARVQGEPVAGAASTGPKVFMNYTQAELDRAYDQDYWVDYSPSETEEFYRTLSEPVTKQFAFSTHAYGPGVDEQLDYFPTAARNGPIFVFVHGGAWLAGSKDESSFAARAFVPRGVNYVALGFSNATTVPLADMADQVRRGIVWLSTHAERLGGDPHRIFIAGHSSGGHLAGLALTTNWNLYNVPQTVLKGGVCISGLYDLYPVSLSYRNHYLRLSTADIQALSPIRNLEWISCPIVVAHAEKDTPEFARQSSEFARRLSQHGRHGSHHIVAKGLNHYDISFTLGHADAVMGNAALRLMGLAQPSVFSGPAGPVAITTWR